MNQLMLELVATSGASSYIAAVLNQPKFPSWARMVVVFVVCLGAAHVQHLQHPQDGVDLSARVALVFGSALLLYNNAIKHLGGEWLTNHVTPDALRELMRGMIDPTLASGPDMGAVAARLKALEALKGDLTEEEYTTKRAAILGEV